MKKYQPKSTKINTDTQINPDHLRSTQKEQAVTSVIVGAVIGVVTEERKVPLVTVMTVVTVVTIH